MQSFNRSILARLTAHYALLQAALNAVYLAVVSFASVFLRYRGMNDFQIGILLAIGTMLSILLQPLLGTLADRMKHIRLGLVVGWFHVAMTPLAVLLIAVTDQLPVIAVAYVLLRCLITVTDPFENSMAMETVNRGYPINFGLAKSFGSVGYSSASFLLGKAVAEWSASAIMPAVILLSLLAAVISMCFRIPGTRQAAAETSKKEDETLGLLEFLRRGPRFALFIVSIALVYYCQEVRANYMYQIVAHIGGTPEQFGTLTAFTSLIEMPAMMFFSFLLKHFRVRSMVLFSGCCMILRTLVIWWAPNLTWMYIGGAMQVVSFGLFWPAAIYYVNEIIGEANRNKGQTFLSAGMCVSTVLSTLIGGGMLSAAEGNPHTMLLSGAAISAAGMIIMIAATSGKDSVIRAKEEAQ